MRMSEIKYNSENGKQQLMGFGGINYSPRYKPGELRNSENLSADEYPWISQRKNACIEYSYITDDPPGKYTSPVAIYAKDEMCVIDSDGKFYYDGDEITGHTFDVEKDIQMVAVNTKILIFPDCWYYDISDEALYPFAAKFETQSSATNIIEVTSSSITITTGSFKSFTDVEDYISRFHIGDTIYFSNTLDSENDKEAITIRNISDDGKMLTFDAGSFTAKTYNATTHTHLYFERLILEAAEGATGTSPMFDYVCEHDNRLWGVRSYCQTIYGSSLGNPLNFNCFEGLSTDSYAVAVGSAGKFTGITGFGSYICFFKENCLHKLYGSKPSNYQIVTSTIPGVERGSSKSLQIINDCLYYKGDEGIYAYSGDTPDLISDNLGTINYNHGVAGADGRKYYISMERAEGDDYVNDFYIYDTIRGIWLRVDNSNIIDFASKSGHVYYLKYLQSGETQANRIYIGDIGDDVSDWSAELCPFYEDTQQRKSYLRLFIRYQFEKTGNLLNVYKKIHGKDTDFVLIKSITATTGDENTIEIPLPPNRCDSFSVKFSGTGRCFIKSLVREYQRGNER